MTGLAFVLLWCSSRGVAFTKTFGLAVSMPTGWLPVLGGFTALTLGMAALVVLAASFPGDHPDRWADDRYADRGLLLLLRPQSGEVFPLGDVGNLRDARSGAAAVALGGRPLLANRGYDLRLIQDYLGHRDPRLTVHYTRIAGSSVDGIWS